MLKSVRKCSPSGKLTQKVDHSQVRQDIKVLETFKSCRLICKWKLVWPHAMARVDAVQSGQNSGHVGKVKSRADVDILCNQRASVRYRGETSDDHELDASVTQPLQQLEH